MRSSGTISAIAAIAFATTASAQQGDQQLRQQIEPVVAAYQDAVNKQDAAAVAGLWTKDGQYVSPFSQPLVKNGPQEIEKSYGNTFKSIKNYHVVINLDQVSPLGFDVALGVGNYHVAGDGQNGPVKLDGLFTVVYVSNDGAWKVRQLTVFTPPPPPK
jgi:uncharacterized protein (TIGR02246 family)